MLQLLSLLAALALIVSAGAGVVSLLAPAPLRLAERLALSWLTGSMTVSFSLWLCSFFFRGLNLQAAMTLLCLGLGAIAFVRRKGYSQIRFTSWDWVLWGLIVTQTVAVSYSSFKHTLGWDGLFNWEFKARIAYESGGALPLTYFADQQWAFSHPEYPLGIPNLELWSYLWLGEANQFWVKAIFPLFYAAGGLLLANLVERLSQQRILGLSSTLLFLFVPQFLVNPGAAITGYADFPLSIFYLGAIGFLILAERDAGWFWLAAFFLSFLPWLKREGIILWLAGGACAFMFRKGRSVRDTILGVSGGFIIFLCWRAFLLANHFSAVADFAGAKSASFSDNLSRLIPTVLTLRQNLLDLESWSLLWYGAAAGTMILLWRRNFRSGLVLLLAILIPLSFDVTVYLFSAWPDYLRHVNLSLSRLIMQVAPTALLLVSLAAGLLVPDLTKSGGTSQATTASAARFGEPGRTKPRESLTSQS